MLEASEIRVRVVIRTVADFLTLSDMVRVSRVCHNFGEALRFSKFVRPRAMAVLFDCCDNLQSEARKIGKSLNFDLLCALADASPNLIQNPDASEGFEHWSLDLPHFWTIGNWTSPSDPRKCFASSFYMTLMTQEIEVSLSDSDLDLDWFLLAGTLFRRKVGVPGIASFHISVKEGNLWIPVKSIKSLEAPSGPRECGVIEPKLIHVLERIPREVNTMLHKKRPIPILEAEPQLSAPLSSIPLLTKVLQDNTSFSDLGSILQIGIQILAIQHEDQGHFLKAAKRMISYLSQAGVRLPGMMQLWKEQTASVFTILECNVVSYLTRNKVKLAGRLIKAIDKALEGGIKLTHRRWHEIRVLQFLAIRNIEKARLLEHDTLPVLALVINRLLEAYIRSYQADHKSAILSLREAFNVQTQHNASERIGSEEDINWFFRVLVVMLYNFAAECYSLYLRGDALQYILKAVSVVKQNQASAVNLEAKVMKFKQQLSPEEDEAQCVETDPEESKFPFLPGGKVSNSEPGKIVEVRQESPPLHVGKKKNPKLPKLKTLNRIFSKDNPYLQYIASVKCSTRFNSVPPSLRNPRA